MKITASRLPLAKHCLWWARPEVELPARPDTTHASFGRQFHLHVAQRINRERTSRERLERKMLDYLDQWTRRFRPGPSWTAEASFAWNPTTDQVAYRLHNYERNYEWCGPGDIAGTADVVACRDTDVLIIDWKTGDPRKVDPPSENWQLLYFGLCATTHFQKEYAVLALGYVSDRHTQYVEQRVHADDLDHMRLQLAVLPSQISDAQPLAGEHCRRKFCPAISICPAHK